MTETYYLSGKDYTHVYAFGASARESYKLIKCEEDAEGHFTFYDYTHTELVLTKNDFDADIELGLLHKISASTWMRLRNLCCMMVDSCTVKASLADCTSDTTRRIIRILNISQELCQAYEAECKAVLYHQRRVASNYEKTPQETEIDDLRNLIDSALMKMRTTDNLEQLSAVKSALSKGITQYTKLNVSRIVHMEG